MDFKGKGRNYLSQSPSYLLPARFFCSSIKKSLGFDLTPRTHGWCLSGDNPGQGCCLALPCPVQRKRSSLLLQGAPTLTLSKHSQILGVGTACRAEFLPVKQQQWCSSFFRQSLDSLFILSQLTCRQFSLSMQGLQALEKPGLRKPSRHCELKSELWWRVCLLPSEPSVCLSLGIFYQIFESHLFWQSAWRNDIAEAVSSSK